MRYYDYKKLYDQGFDYLEIAQRCGVSRQAVYCSLRRGIVIPEPNTVFPAINRWMSEHHSNILDMEKKSGMTLRNALKSGKMTKRAVDAVLKVTGLTYEEAFAQ